MQAFVERHDAVPLRANATWMRVARLSRPRTSLRTRGLLVTFDTYNHLVDRTDDRRLI
jgi:hypothetical protein